MKVIISNDPWTPWNPVRRAGRIPTSAVTVLLVAAVTTSAAMAWAGSTGGKIRHTEIRDGAATTHSDWSM